jgi:M penetrans paralogue family 26
MTEQQNLLSTNNYNQSNNLPNATASLVLGIISILGGFCYGVVGVICGIIGLVLANKDRKLYNENPDNYSASSYSTLNAGRVCSIIGLIIGGLVVLSIIFAIAFFGTAIMNEALRQQGR